MRQAHLRSALRSCRSPASGDGGEFLQQELLAQRVESKVLPHVDADGPHLTETKQDGLAEGLVSAPSGYSNADTADLCAQHKLFCVLVQL